MPFTSVLYILGWTTAPIGAAMAGTALFAFLVGEQSEGWAFLTSALVSGFFGTALVIGLRGAPDTESRRDAFLLPVLVSVALPVLSALPIYFGTDLQTLTDAYFEAVSALTTTGTTVFSEPAVLPQSILLWRSQLQWIGGFLTLVLFLAVLHPVGTTGLRVIVNPLPRGDAEGLFGHVIHSVQLIWWPYLLLTLLCISLLMVAGMPAFDAVNYGFVTVSTGGFGLDARSLAAYDSVLIEAVILPFMWAGAFSCIVLWLVASGRYREVLQNPEVRYFASFLIAAYCLAVIGLYGTEDGTDNGIRARELFRILFHVSSVLSTTGLYTELPGGWEPYAATLMMVLLWIGGSVGSTAGGLKLMRFTLLLKHAGQELSRLSHPHSVLRVRYGGYVVEGTVLAAVWTYFVVFVLCVAAVSLSLGADGLAFRDAVGMAAATLSNAGPAAHLAGVDTDLQQISDLNKLLLSFGMIVGRLEIFAVIALFSPSFWRR